MVATENARRASALAKLAALRQAKGQGYDRETAAAYLTELTDVPAWAVERACQDIGRQRRAEYEKAFPELGQIREVALTHVRLEKNRRESQRLLTAPEYFVEPSPEVRDKFLADLRKLCGSKVMR